MEIKTCLKPSFCVIGKKGSTGDGDGFVQKLWEEANLHFGEIEPLVKRDAEGNPTGFWGAMSDFSESFQPWENGFSKGLYLAGAEVREDAQPPEGWTKWTIPSYEYLYTKAGEANVFPLMIRHIADNGLSLAGAVHEFYPPQENGQAYLLFPIRRV